MGVKRGGDVRRGELVHVEVPGAGTTLAAAWYPGGAPSRQAVLHLHGKGGNFYSGAGLFMPQLDHAAEFSHLSLNMRCHDLGYTRYDLPVPDVQEGVIPVAGGMWERLADGYDDVAAAVRWLRARGHARIVVVGHSSGAYYALEACARPGLELGGVVLMSTVISYKRHLRYWFSQHGVDAALAQAREHVARGEGHRLLPVTGWYYAISAESLLERWEQPDDAFESLLDAARCPLMFVSGELEPRVPQWRALYERVRAPGKRWLVLSGASHDYGGSEPELTDAVLEFARDSLVLSADR
jgi:pimeloyl-ACP methyl ester carboxylesterase